MSTTPEVVPDDYEGPAEYLPEYDPTDHGNGED